MTGVFLSTLRYDWCAPLSHPSSCMFVNFEPSQQSSKEEYKPWKWGATARYYASYTIDLVTNEEVHAKIQQAIGPHEYLLTIVKRHKLQWHGQVSCSSGLAKTILQVTVRGGRRQGICGAPMTLAVKGLMMMIIIIINCLLFNYCFFLFILRWSCANWQDVKFQLHKIISFLFFFYQRSCSTAHLLFTITPLVFIKYLVLCHTSCSSCDIILSVRRLLISEVSLCEPAFKYACL